MGIYYNGSKKTVQTPDPNAVDESGRISEGETRQDAFKLTMNL
jgi:hypothetical protein